MLMSHNIRVVPPDFSLKLFCLGEHSCSHVYARTTAREAQWLVRPLHRLMCSITHRKTSPANNYNNTGLKWLVLFYCFSYIPHVDNVILYIPYTIYRFISHMVNSLYLGSAIPCTSPTYVAYHLNLVYLYNLFCERITEMELGT